MTRAFDRIDEAAREIVTEIYGPGARPDVDCDERTIEIMECHGLGPEYLALVLYRVTAIFEARLFSIYQAADERASAEKAA